MPAGRILVTGFEPFDDGVNASQATVESLRDDPPAALAPFADQLAFAILPVDTERIGARVDALLAERPSAWLLTGQDASRDRICIETRARNRRCFRSADNAGRLVRDEPVVAGAPDELAVTMPGVAKLVATLRAHGLPAAVSDDAGAYLCNQALYLALHRASSRAGPVPIGFVHLPLLPEQAERRAGGCASLSLAHAREAIARIVLALRVRLTWTGHPQKS